MTDVVIAAAARTPVGAFNGGLSTLPAHELGTIAIKEALKNQCTTLALQLHSPLQV
jgi:acetyl-CoA C-acetyltransferase